MSINARVTQAASQLMSINMLMWLTMLTLFAGILFLASAVYMAIAAVLVPALAGLIAGVSLLGVFVLLAIVTRLVVRAPSQPAEPEPAEPDDNTDQHNATPALAEHATEWARNNSDIVIAGALVSGVALAVSPGLRHFVMRTAGPLVARKVMRSAQEFARQ